MKKQNESLLWRYFSKRVLVVTMIAVVVMCTVFELAGISVFNIPESGRLILIGEYLNAWNLGMIASSLVLTATMVLIAMTCTKTELKADLVVVCMLLSFASQVKVHPVVPTSIALIVCLIFGRHQIRLTLCRYINLMVITGSVQILSSIYKFGFYKIGADFSVSDILVYSIDNIVLLIAIYYDRKGVAAGEEGEESQWLELVYPFARRSQVLSGIGKATGEKGEGDHSQVVLSHGDKVLMILVSILQLGVVAAAVTLNSRFIVWLIVYIFGYFPQKIKTGFDYHAATLLGCTVQSIVVFYVACAVVPEVGISVLLPVVSGMLVVVVIQIAKGVLNRVK